MNKREKNSGSDRRFVVQESFEERMRRLGIKDADLSESFARSGGPGGQNVNKVSTAVTLRHGPSGIAVTVQHSRSQAQNRKLARERLIGAIEQRERNQRQARIAARERERRRTSPRPHALKEKILKSKKKRALAKKLRGAVEE